MTEEREVEDMERRADALKEDIEETKAEWDAKKSDANVPGAKDEKEESGEEEDED
jgi:hypothetical protein